MGHHHHHHHHENLYFQGSGLSTKSQPVIQATLPVIAERIPHITPVFYGDMLQARPDLLDGMFSRSAQRDGTQARALAGSIAIFAQWILQHPNTFPEEMLSRVANKHASLGLQPDEYDTVYKYLFGAIAKDLGDAATPDIVEAWTEVYWLLARALINLERKLYAQQANNIVRAKFKLVKRTQVTKDVVDMVFEPADNTAMTPGKAGQYISIYARTSDGLLQPRQFTLLPSEETQRRIAIKLDPHGEMTTIFQNQEVGALLDISNPYGDMTLETLETDPNSPLVLICAGIGVTPVLAFVEKLAAQKSEREVMIIASSRSLAEAPLRGELLERAKELKKAKVLYGTTQEKDGDFVGRIDVSTLDIPANASVFLCGPLKFMQEMRSHLVEAGIAKHKIFYEIFGTDQWMLHDQNRSE
uniref:Flavohemoglobin n=1 Tax=Malassezia yamatoensis TaxID=253288 RepID=UPI001035507C|nr:Chain A, Flavohemoglobin [Malassezia yamatoensis]